MSAKIDLFGNDALNLEGEATSFDDFPADVSEENSHGTHAFEVTSHESVSNSPSENSVESEPSESVQQELESLRSQVESLQNELSESKHSVSGLTDELHANKADFNGVMKTSRDCILTSRTDGKILQGNESIFSKLGYSYEDLLEKNIRDLLPEPFRSKLDTFLSNYQRSGNTERLERIREVEAETKDGERLPCEMKVQVIDVPGQLDNMLITTIRDITGKNKLLEEIKNLEATLDSTEDAVISVTTTGKIKSWSAGAVKLFGYQQREIIGEYVSVLSPDDRQSEMEGLVQLIQSGEDISAIDSVKKKKSGTLIDVALSIKPVFDAEEQVVAGTFVFRDIAEKKVTEQSLSDCRQELSESESQLKKTRELVALQQTTLEKSQEESDQAVGKRNEWFLKVNQGIRKSVLSIQESMELLNSAQSVPETASANLSISQHGKYLLNVTDDLRDLLSIECGSTKIRFDRCSPFRIAAEVAAKMKPLVDQRGLSFELQFRWPIPETIETDPRRFAQILRNLIMNSLEYTDAGKIRLLLQLLEGEGGKTFLQFDVIDHTTGMTDGELEEMFTPQVRSTVNENCKLMDTGLGMYISREMARKLGGDLSTASIPGKGRVLRGAIPVGALHHIKMIKSPQEVGM